MSPPKCLQTSSYKIPLSDFLQPTCCQEHLWIQRISSCRLSPLCCLSLRRAAGPHRSTVTDTMSSDAGQVTANGSPTSSDVVIGVTSANRSLTRRALVFENESSASPLDEPCADLSIRHANPLGMSTSTLSRRVYARHECRALRRRQDLFYGLTPLRPLSKPRAPSADGS